MRDLLGIADLPSYAKSLLYYLVMISGVLTLFVNVFLPSDRYTTAEYSVNMGILVLSAMVTHAIVYRRRLK